MRCIPAPCYAHSTDDEDDETEKFYYYTWEKMEKQFLAKFFTNSQLHPFRLIVDQVLKVKRFIKSSEICWYKFCTLITHQTVKWGHVQGRTVLTPDD